ncbi:aconitase family protein [Daldinia caldariorum]|uniref:aconitase family protein n=1 Tax=Daldinia caldariorum TaxID=326644 RepID=UPI002008AD8D|nr:aconitase family protein [Daldinia caldariorum]KAI1469831.1 aconitase family protein [Daldinia caldariorum]
MEVSNQIDELLRTSRNVYIWKDTESQASIKFIRDLGNLALEVRSAGYQRECEVLQHVAGICLTSPNHGGLGLTLDTPIVENVATEVLLLIAAWLESLNSADRERSLGSRIIRVRLADRPPMNLTEKIFAMHDVDSKGFVSVGDTIRVSVDWIMASEASWGSMEATYNQLGSPGIFRNDRFWLAGDHVVDPRVNTHPRIKPLIEASERARRVFKMTEYQGMNYTIMHTEFFRERAQPGMLVIGSDSHTCSAGAVGSLAIGLGAADVTMALVTGEIWFKVPEIVQIRFVGEPPQGIGGKDVILYVLQQLKRNTVAADRVVEYTGPGLNYLSPDARFAIANMTTEFGGISGIFETDDITKSFIDSRKIARHRNSSYFMRPDRDARYADTATVDLSRVQPFVAKYPCPDDVVPVSEVQGQKLDGCFIGACTTAEEDIITGALILEQGLKAGKIPVPHGKRKVVPGSKPILDRLEKSGLADIYRTAGFEVGVPGCSYCVGMSADQAGPGEVWLSSQNRNFENRMGKGSIGNLASAATVAASSFEMAITNPQALLNTIDPARFDALKGRGSLRVISTATSLDYVEPASVDHSRESGSNDIAPNNDGQVDNNTEAAKKMHGNKIRGKIQKLGDFIDTDALAPAQFLVESKTDEALGAHCLEFTNPDFRRRVNEGYDIVVAGKAFGCGSSRQQAVSALIGCGVKCVIARSFAFIYSRNQPSLGLLGITISDDDFHSLAQDDVEISIDLDENMLYISDKGFPFQLSPMVKQLMNLGGITPAFQKFGKQLFEALCSDVAGSRRHSPGHKEVTGVLQW